jgi:hypothetical protein
MIQPILKQTYVRKPRRFLMKTLVSIAWLPVSPILSSDTSTPFDDPLPDAEMRSTPPPFINMTILKLCTIRIVESQTKFST